MSSVEQSPRRAIFAENWLRVKELGYSPIPLYPLGTTDEKGAIRDKSPCIDGWNRFRERTISTEEVNRRLATLPNAEIGVVCGFDGLAGVDIDTRDKALQAAIIACLPDAPRRMGNPEKAGLLMFRWVGVGPQPNRKSRGNAGMIVELLGPGAQFVIPPSAHPSGAVYRMSCGELPALGDLPEIDESHVAALLTVVEPFLSRKPVDGVAAGSACPAVMVDDETAIRTVANYLTNAARVSVQGEGGHHNALHVFNMCQDFGCTPEKSIELMFDLWNERCDPPWETAADLAHELRSLTRRSPIGCLHPSAKIESAYEVLPPAAETFNYVTGDSLESVALQPQEWVVRDLIPARVVTLLSGDGGTGKSLISLQLAIAAAAGTQWLGLPVARSGALFLTAEDEIEECHRRLNAIVLNSVDLSYKTLKFLSIVSLDGEDAVLASPGRNGQMQLTAVYKKLHATISRLLPKVVILDTLADLFGGDEIKRAHTRQFIGFLRALCREFGVSIVLLAHPSLSGIASGSGISGSTAWNNSVRSRLYLECRLDAQKREPDADIRVLTTKKANRGKKGGEIVARWRNGFFVREIEASESDLAARESTCREVFLLLLDVTDQEGRNVSHNIKSPAYAPRVFASHDASRGFSKEDFEQAMEQLFSAKLIKVGESGPPSKRYHKLIKVAEGGQETGLFD